MIPTEGQLKEWVLETARYEEVFLREITEYQMEKLASHIDSEIQFYNLRQRVEVGASLDNKREYYLARFMIKHYKLMRVIDRIGRNELENKTFLTSIRQVAGFFWYLEQTGENHKFTEDAAGKVKEILKKPGSKTTNEQAIRDFNSFRQADYRRKHTIPNIRDLEAIICEGRRLKKQLEIAETDYQVALSNNEL